MNILRKLKHINNEKFVNRIKKYLKNFSLDNNILLLSGDKNLIFEVIHRPDLTSAVLKDRENILTIKSLNKNKNFEFEEYYLIENIQNIINENNNFQNSIESFSENNFEIGVDVDLDLENNSDFRSYIQNTLQIDD